MIALLVLFASPAAGMAQARPPLGDPAVLNIGIVCHWQRRCMANQQRAMKRALSYVKKQQPPVSRIHLCNRNASRGGNRVDWIGFDNCIRNASLRTHRASQLRAIRGAVTRA